MLMRRLARYHTFVRVGGNPHDMGMEGNRSDTTCIKMASKRGFETTNLVEAVA